MALHPSGPLHRARDQAIAIWKRLLSYRKRDWELADYPVVLEIRAVDSDLPPKKDENQRHLARIVNWWLIGVGATPSEALKDLQKSFESARAAREAKATSLPRPGKKVPVEFATDERIQSVGELADDFVKRVLGLEWAFMSDESSLWDFHGERDNSASVRRIRQVYGVDVSDIESANIAAILERVAAESKRPSVP